MINKILVPVDGSDHASKAIELAATMANQNDATVYLLLVVKKTEITEPVLDYIESEGIKDTPYVVCQQLVESQIIAPAIVEAKNKGIKHVESTVIHGDPAEEIISYAKERDIDMIVMGSRGLGSIKGFMMGSVSTKVCHGTDRTCVIVRRSLLDGKRILIADDEPDVLETLEELLPMCDVVNASTFYDAKELLENRSFDMAILDIMGINGYELLDIAKDKKVTTVMLTAHALSPQHLIKAHKKGAASYVPKDEMAEITTYLKDILEAEEKGRSSWWRWLDRLGSYFDKVFGPDWQKEEKTFWDQFPHCYF
ncbi:MAG: universal stress protein [Desulfobacteraceae bacterium]|nr:universal stress protein [Desulfobacteraceae bacterium]